MRILALAMMVFAACAAQAEPAKRMAVTIDDLPISQPSWHTPQQMQQITAGVDPALFRGEPEVPGWVEQLASGS